MTATSVVFGDNPTQFFNNLVFKAGTVESSQGTVTKGNAAGDTDQDRAQHHPARRDRAGELRRADQAAGCTAV